MADVELSPAERYAASRRRATAARTELATFRELLGFQLDDFQVAGVRGPRERSRRPRRRTDRRGQDRRGGVRRPPRARARPQGVLHDADQGAVQPEVRRPRAPLRAGTGRAAHRRHTVNGDAPVVVMTTEVLRNMLYAGSEALHGLGYVVMDEVHYLADRFRGPVWEEVIIHLPPEVQLVSLSATVSNAEEFGDWLEMVRGDTAVVVSEHRPVPLGQHVLTRDALLDLYAGHVDPTAPGANPPINPDLMIALRRRDREGGPGGHGGTGNGHGDGRGRGDRGYRGGGGRGGFSGGSAGFRPTPRFAVVDILAEAGLLPAIYFIFSRAGCQGAVAQCLTAGRPADHARAGGADPADRRGALRDHPARGPAGARLLGVERGAGPRRRRAPRRDAAAVQGDRRGPVLARAGQGRVRDRDARARHQHARAVGRAGEAGQVGRLEPRRRHAGGVHPAHRARGAARHRHRGSRRGRRPPGAGPGRARRPGVQAPVPAAVELPSDVQHGGQPRRAGGPGAGAGGARDVLRAVPGRPRRRRAGPAGAGAHRGPGRVRRGDALPPR